jgi:ankyrin repeat protein
MSRFEHGQTPLHFAISRRRHDILDLLIELGADLEARDLSGRTALEAAMMGGDKEATQRLHDAGAQAPRVQNTADFTARMSALAKSVAKGVPMMSHRLAMMTLPLNVRMLICALPSPNVA